MKAQPNFIGHFKKDWYCICIDITVDSEAQRKRYCIKIFMSIAVSRRHREHRSTIAVESWPNRRVILPQCSYALLDLVMLCTLSLRPTPFRGDCAINIAKLGASATLPLRSWRSGQLQAWIKCFMKLILLF